MGSSGPSVQSFHFGIRSSSSSSSSSSHRAFRESNLEQSKSNCALPRGPATKDRLGSFPAPTRYNMEMMETSNRDHERWRISSARAILSMRLWGEPGTMNEAAIIAPQFLQATLALLGPTKSYQEIFWKFCRMSVLPAPESCNPSRGTRLPSPCLISILRDSSYITPPAQHHILSKVGREEAFASLDCSLRSHSLFHRSRKTCHTLLTGSRRY